MKHVANQKVRIFLIIAIKFVTCRPFGSILNDIVNRYDDLTVGGEYQLMDMIFLRGGMSLPQLEDESSQTDEVLGGVNFGAGLKYNLFGTNLLVEYTYRSQKYFDGNSLISLSLGF